MSIAGSLPRVSSSPMHPDRRRAIAAALAAAAALGALAACSVPRPGGSASRPASAPSSPQQRPYQASPAPRAGGVIAVGVWQFPSTLSPYIRSQVAAVPIQQAIDDGLLGSGPDVGWYGDLAQQVPTVENGGVRPAGDGMDVTYRLRPGLAWSDGQPITPDDVIFTYQLITGPGRAAGVSKEGYDRLTGVEAAGADGVVLHFGSLFPAYRDLFPVILPRHRLAGLTGAQLVTDPFWSRPDVVSGPFTVQEVTADHVTLARNPRYGDGRVEMPFLGHPAYADRVVFRALATRQAVIAALEAGEVQVALDMTERELPTLTRLAGVRAVKAPSLAYEQVSLNQARPNPATGGSPPWVGDPAVAEALDLAMDRAGIVGRLGGPPLTATPVSPLVGWAYDAAQRPSAFDLDRGRRTLDRDGWAVGADGVRVKAGRRLAFTLSTIANQPLRATERDLLVQGWRRLGADVHVLDFTSAQLFGSLDQGGVLATGRYEAALWSWVVPIDPDSEYLVLHSSSTPAADRPGAQNYSRCHDVAIDQGLAAGRATLDEGSRGAAYRAFQGAYVRARCELPVYRRLDIGATSPRLRNFALNPGPAGNTWNVADWWLI